MINPNGVLFGQGAQINVCGLVASTLDMSDASLSSTTRTFSGNDTASVLNNDRINAASGGYVALLGSSVSTKAASAHRVEPRLWTLLARIAQSILSLFQRRWPMDPGLLPVFGLGSTGAVISGSASTAIAFR